MNAVDLMLEVIRDNSPPSIWTGAPWKPSGGLRIPTGETSGRNF